MSVLVNICDGPLDGRNESAIENAGAAVVFEGIVRGLEDGRAIQGLEYTTYEPMATLELDRLATHVLDRHGLLGIDVEHSRGRVPVGTVSFRLRVWAPHRKEALAAMEEFIDAMKRDVPIWKSAY